ncbi:hypothetical protein EDI_096980 [Entamoeba dispar SAW760]|uniref:Serine/threonine-protein phosphatase 4 regulatory subunit 3-like central domain-containing protein n=1 Tax=Entamoeba dispar (strain ATCC PRA-260 / SAW760) TaxID=370354 RepID=B0EBC4_ENTDS|nr:uncharacterized protein EDI_096980 [Entamoeba dispar SAW760]EDR28175.1 hypothetical protein EDI_096980 [Entamoeba dispar SAW760]|eukprot:EDR28175.1 hypothetical protein EDI_096980 [Entamoeba dispar SAW760]
MNHRKTIVGKSSHLSSLEWNDQPRPSSVSNNTNSVLKGIKFNRPPPDPVLPITKMEEIQQKEEAKAFRLSVENPQKQFSIFASWADENQPNGLLDICSGTIQYNEDSMVSITVTIKDFIRSATYSFSYNSNSIMQESLNESYIKISNVSYSSNIPYLQNHQELVLCSSENAPFQLFVSKLRSFSRIAEDESNQTSELSTLRSNVTDPEGYVYNFSQPTKELFENLRGFAVMAIDNGPLTQQFLSLFDHNNTLFKCTYKEYLRLLNIDVSIEKYISDKQTAEKIKNEVKLSKERISSEQIGQTKRDNEESQLYEQIKQYGNECKRYIEAYLEKKQRIQTILDIYRACFSINNECVYDHLLKEETLYQLFDIYQRDPNLEKQINFWEDSEKVQIKQIILYPPIIIKKLKYIVKLNYLRDVVVARFLDEASSRYFTWYINNTRLSVVKLMRDNYSFMNNIKQAFEDGNSDIKSQVLSFFSSILKIYSGSVSSSLENTKLTFDEIKKMNIFSITIQGYSNADYFIRSKAVDLLTDMFVMDSFECTRAIYSTISINGEDVIPIVVICSQFIKEDHRSLIMNISHHIIYLLKCDSSDFSVEEKRINSSLIYSQLVPILARPLQLFPSVVTSKLREQVKMERGINNFDSLVTQLFEIIGYLFIYHSEYCEIYFETESKFIQVVETWINCSNEVLETAILHCLKKILEKSSGVSDISIIRNKIVPIIVHKYVCNSNDGIIPSLISSIFEILVNEEGNVEIIDDAQNYLQELRMEVSPELIDSSRANEVFKIFSDYLRTHKLMKMSFCSMGSIPRSSFVKKFSLAAQKRRMSESSDQEVGGKRKGDTMSPSYDPHTTTTFGSTTTNNSNKQDKNISQSISGITNTPLQGQVSDDTPDKQIRYMVFSRRKSTFS